MLSLLFDDRLDFYAPDEDNLMEKVVLVFGMVLAEEEKLLT